MNRFNLGQMMPQLRNGPIIFVLVMFGLVLLGVHVLRADLPARWSRQATSHNPILAGIRQHAQLLEQPDQPNGKAQPVIQVTVPRQTYTVQELRDPMVGPWHLARWAEEAQRRSMRIPVKAEPFVPPPLTVEGVILAASSSFAIVNGETVRLGDTIAGAEVIRIERDGIVVKFRGRELRYMTGSRGPDGSNQPAAGGQPEAVRPWPSAPGVSRTPF